jgi:glycosyltransferase involved in cell wall biosynthesis
MHIAVEAEMAWRNTAGTGSYVRSLFAAMEEVAPHHTYHYLYSGTGAPGALDLGSKGKARRLVNGLKQTVWIQYSLPSRIRRTRADVFHAPATVGPYWQPCPAVFTLHDLAVIRYPGAFDPLWRWWAREALHVVVPRAAAVIAVSESSRRDAIEQLGLQPERVHVVYHGCDPLFRPIADAPLRDAVIDRLGLREPFILSVGTLEPRKNVTRLLQAFRRLKDEYSVRHQLVVVGGKGWLYRTIFDEVQRLGLVGQVMFTGYVAREDLPALYGAAELLVYPSLYEGFGLPPLEAMACGCPVVTSDRSSLPEVVGEAAICVDPTDVGGMADAIAAVIHDPTRRVEMIRRGLERARLFSWERAAEETLEVYALAMQRGAGLAAEVG